MEIAVVVLPEGIAGQIPAVANIIRLTRVGEVTTSRRTAHGESAYGPSRNLAHVLVKDFRFISFDRFACASRSGIAETIGDKNVQHLCRADGLQHRLASLRHPRLVNRSRQ